MKTKTVKCEECKHLIREEDAKVVEYEDYIYTPMFKELRYYCPLHTKEYFKHKQCVDFSQKYYQNNVECNERGELLEVLRVKETWKNEAYRQSQEEKGAFEHFTVNLILIGLSCFAFPLGLWVGVSM